jgi:hypothetical protein
LTQQLGAVKIKSPIEQHMLGSGGLFRQENVEKRRVMSVREWAELCRKEDFRAPGINDVGLHARSNAPANKSPKRLRKKAEARDAETAEPETASVIKDDGVDQDMEVDGLDDECLVSDHPTIPTPESRCIPTTPEGARITPPESSVEDKCDADGASRPPSPPPADGESKEKIKPKRSTQSRESREASLAERAARDAEFLKGFNPHADWLPPHTSASDYTYEFCQKLERQYWRNCGLGKPAWYGADSQGVFPSFIGIAHKSHHIRKGPFTRMRLRTGTSLISHLHCPDFYLLQRVYQA